MASQPSTAPSTNGVGPSRDGMAEWLAQAIDQGVQPDQALAFMGLGLMRSLQVANPALAPFWPELPEGADSSVDLTALRQRLDITDLAIRTGAPLSTAEVAQLLGARPGSAVVQRGGLVARRLGRNVWRLSRNADNDSSQANRVAEDGFRRRL
ncbi:MAG: hypothetical protein RLZZ374_368 [Cyanobacteriota bacterium]|jgi:hypothetical protein